MTIRRRSTLDPVIGHISAERRMGCNQIGRIIKAKGSDPAKWLHRYRTLSQLLIAGEQEERSSPVIVVASPGI